MCDVGEGLITRGFIKANQGCLPEHGLDACGGVFSERDIGVAQQRLKMLSVDAVIGPAEVLKGLFDEVVCAVEVMLFDGDVRVDVGQLKCADQSLNPAGDLWDKLCANDTDGAIVREVVGCAVGQSWWVLGACDHGVVTQTPDGENLCLVHAPLLHQRLGVLAIGEKDIWGGQAKRWLGFLLGVEVSPVIFCDQAMLHCPFFDPRCFGRRDRAPDQIKLITIHDELAAALFCCALNG